MLEIKKTLTEMKSAFNEFSTMRLIAMKESLNLRVYQKIFPNGK